MKKYTNMLNADNISDILMIIIEQHMFFAERLKMK